MTTHASRHLPTDQQAAELLAMLIMTGPQGEALSLEAMIRNAMRSELNLAIIQRSHPNASGNAIPRVAAKPLLDLLESIRDAKPVATEREAFSQAYATLQTMLEHRQTEVQCSMQAEAVTQTEHAEGMGVESWELGIGQQEIDSIIQRDVKSILDRNLTGVDNLVAALARFKTLAASRGIELGSTGPAQG